MRLAAVQLKSFDTLLLTIYVLISVRLLIVISPLWAVGLESAHY